MDVNSWFDYKIIALDYNQTFYFHRPLVLRIIETVCYSPSLFLSLIHYFTRNSPGDFPVISPPIHQNKVLTIYLCWLLLWVFLPSIFLVRISVLNIVKADTEKLNFNTLFTKDISHAIFLYLDICTRPLTVVFLSFFSISR